MSRVKKILECFIVQETKMETKMETEVGTTYYKLSFADAKLTMPGLEPMVYVGKDIFEYALVKNLYYFQDAASVLKFGVLGEGTKIVVQSFTEKELASSIVTLEQATKKIASAYNRFLEHGSPKLHKVIRK